MCLVFLYLFLKLLDTSVVQIMSHSTETKIQFLVPDEKKGDWIEKSDRGTWANDYIWLFQVVLLVDTVLFDTHFFRLPRYLF